MGGADSWLDPERLEAIDFAGRLHSVNYSWGFTPGEAAGLCLVTTGASARRLGLNPLAELLAVATAQEMNLMSTQTVCIGEGLTDAFRGVLTFSQALGLRVAHCFCDFNGETYRANEYGFAICRTREAFEDPGRFTAGAECWGDVGAASGPLALALPLAAWSRGYACGRVMLAWSSSASARLHRCLAEATCHAIQLKTMPITINVNNLSLCHKGSNGISTATIPDVCNTPSPGGPVPIPYPNIAFSSDLMNGTTTVTADGGNMSPITGRTSSRARGTNPGVLAASPRERLSKKQRGSRTRST